MNSHKISWGKVIVGAAIAAGAVAAFIYAAPTLQENVIPKLVEWSKEIGSGIASAWNWVGQHVIGGVGTASSGIVGAITENPGLSIAGAATAGALIGAAGHSKNKGPSVEEQSFAAREDIRRMQALMVARMQAQGYQPAMAMNSGMTR